MKRTMTRRVERLEMIYRPEAVSGGLDAFYRDMEAVERGEPPSLAAMALANLYAAMEERTT